MVQCAKPTERVLIFFQNWHYSHAQAVRPRTPWQKLKLKMKAYISGDTREGNEKFVNAVKTLWLQGYDCITPADISSLGNTSKNFTIRKRIHTLLDCDAIYMLEGWRKSREARLEHFVALHTGIQIIKEKQQ